jgi:protocatechuate 3,4-dioxygenase beta subunit
MRAPLLSRIVFAALIANLPAQHATGPLVGTVVDPDGKPVVDAAITIARAEGRGFSCLDLVLRHSWIEQAKVRTDQLGRFALQLPLGAVLRVEIDKAPFARWRNDDVIAGEELQIRLEPGCTLRGRLVHADTGAGATGSLRAWHPRTQVDLLRGRADATGAFQFDRLPAGPFLLELAPTDAVTPTWYEGNLTPDAPHECQFALAKGTRVFGTVTDADTGEPIAGATLGEGWVLHRPSRSDAKGRFERTGFGSEGRPDLHCDAPGYMRERRILDVAGQESARVDFTLMRGVPVVGRITDRDGQPLAGAYVAAICETTSSIPWRATRTAADGTFTCDGFPRAAEGVLLVRLSGYATVVYNLPKPAGDGQIDFGTAQLPRPQIVEGIVRGTDGKPCAGCEVTLRGTNADRDERDATPASWSRLRIYVGEREVRTDAHGRFAFGDVPPGRFELALGDYCSALPAIAEVEVVANQNPAKVELER